MRTTTSVILGCVAVFGVATGLASCGTARGPEDGPAVDAGQTDSGLVDTGDSGLAIDGGGSASTCFDRECGPDGDGGSCGTCVVGQECTLEGRCEVCMPDCAVKTCGEDGGCGLKCRGPCLDPDDECVGGPDWLCMPLGCQPRCDGRICGEPDGCGGKCVGFCPGGKACDVTTFACGDPCANAVNCGDIGLDGRGCYGNGECVDSFAVCVSGANGFDCIGDPDMCSIYSKCGDSNGMGGMCFGPCPNPGDVCDPNTITCIPDPCAPKNCGETAPYGFACTGPCPNAGEECRVNQAQTAYECVACNTGGCEAGAACAARAECRCGTDCAIIFEGQMTGECLEDCMATGGKCPDATQLCLGIGDDHGSGNATGVACFQTGKMAGTITRAKVLDSCSDQPAETDMGSGTVTVTLPGKTASVNIFTACRWIDAGTEPPTEYVLVQGTKACGTQTCPDVIMFGVETSAVKVGGVDAKAGAVFGMLLDVAFTGDGFSGEWLRAASFNSGSLDITAAGTGNRELFSAKDINLSMVKYDWEICGGATGVECGDDLWQ